MRSACVLRAPSSILSGIRWCIRAAGIPPIMRVCITRRSRVAYDLAGDSLLVGRIYDLPSELASALVIEGCTQFADTTVTKETRHLRGEKGTSAKVHDRPGLLGKGRAGK